MHLLTSCQTHQTSISDVLVASSSVFSCPYLWVRFPLSLWAKKGAHGSRRACIHASAFRSNVMISYRFENCKKNDRSSGCHASRSGERSAHPKVSKLQKLQKLVFLLTTGMHSLSHFDSLASSIIIDKRVTVPKQYCIDQQWRLLVLTKNAFIAQWWYAH